MKQNRAILGKIILLPFLLLVALAQAQPVEMVAPYNAKGAWRLATSEYWQTFDGKAMNQPVQEIITDQPSKVLASSHTKFRTRTVDPIVGTPIIANREIPWGKFEGVDGIIIRNCTVRFNRLMNQGSGLNFAWCRNVRIENTTFICEGDVDPAIGGAGYGAVFTGSSDITLVNCRFIKCHMGAMFTGNTTRFAVYDSTLEDTWALDPCHGWASNGLIVRCKFIGKYGRLHIGNVTLPDGGSNFSVIDSSFSVLEFSGRITTAKVQNSTFKDVIFNQYRRKEGDALTDYSQSGIEIDGTCKFQSLQVKQL